MNPLRVNRPKRVRWHAFLVAFSVLVLVSSLAGYVVPHVRAPLTLYRIDPKIGGYWRSWYSISTDGTSLYVPEVYSHNNTRILMLDSSNLGTENPSWTILGETPRGKRLYQRHIITRDGAWMYGFGIQVPNDGSFGLVRLNLANPSVGYAYCTKNDGSVLKHHFYFPSLVEDNQARIYVAEYYGNYNACIWRASGGQTLFSLFRNITAEWLSQGYPDLPGSIAHLHSISFNSDYSRLYFSWDEGGGWVDMATNTTSFRIYDSLPEFGEKYKRLSCVTEQTLFGEKLITAFSDENWVHSFLLDSNAWSEIKYNWVNFTTATPFFENPVTVWGDKLLVSFFCGTLEDGHKGGFGYLSLLDGSWTCIHENGVSSDYYSVRIGDYIYFCASGGQTEDERRGIFYFDINDLPQYDSQADWRAFRYLINHITTSTSNGHSNPPWRRPRFPSRRSLWY